MTMTQHQTSINWSERAKVLVPDGRALINGQRCHSLSGEVFSKTSPIDGHLLGQVARGQAADIDAAVIAARQSFNSGSWSRRAPSERKLVLQRFAAAITAAGHELALLETLDMGKPISHALQVDVSATARCIQWYGEAVDKLYGEVAPTGPQALALITREPVGVVGVIVPWNYPMLMAAWKLGPALAAGNSVVLKPSEKSPYTAMRLAELALQAGLPEGVLNVVPGYGHEAGEALALHPDVDAIGFTGSTRIGRKMLEYASRSNLKRVYNELGGKSAVLVFPDCGNLDQAAEAVASAMFYNAGQSCNAPSRVLVHQSVLEEFTASLCQHAKTYTPGAPLTEQTTMGALVDDAQLRSVLRHIEIGQAEGAQLLLGGQRTGLDSGGSYVLPTVFGGLSPAMTIAQEEIFGPVIGLMPFDTEEQAINLANSTAYGLQAGIWSRDIHRAHRVARSLRAGTVHVNQYDEDDITVPFGGYKQSGNGRDKSLHAFDKYTELKTTWMRLEAD
jgi:gamma-glutamyl-gamma-aminobutyraldehyde dehydrogenase